MAGALTANTVVTEVANVGETTDEEVILATVSMLSPVDGANNVLLKASVFYSCIDAEDELTLQFYRAGITADIADTVLGAAIGPAFTFIMPDNGNADSMVRVMAIDSGAGLTSGYALTAVATDTGAVNTAGVYIDALLFD